MIEIEQDSEALKEWLLGERGEGKVNRFAIKKRLGFALDVYIETDEPERYRSAAELSPRGLVNLFPLTPDEAQEDYYRTLFAHGANEVEESAYYRCDYLKPDVLHTAPQPEPRVVMYYSYKGGVGRTTTAVGHAVYLASRGKKVGIIDADIEAPGYQNFFDGAQLLTGGNKGNGLVEFLCDASYRGDGAEALDVANYVVMPNIASQDARMPDIYMVPGGNLSHCETNDPGLERRNREQYTKGLACLNLANTQQFVRLLKLLIEKLCERYKLDVVLIDSRTGFNDVFGAVSLNLAHTVVGFFGPSAQNAPGLAALLEQYYSAGNFYNLVLVSSILPPEDEFNREWLRKQREKLAQMVKEAAQRSERADVPQPLLLSVHRDPVFERLGEHDDLANAHFIEEASGKSDGPLADLYLSISEYAGIVEPKGQPDPTTLNVRKLCSNVIDGFRESLQEAAPHAEACENITRERFFYREWMADLFDPQKFIIRGHKGTGKTYVYKALSENGPVCKYLEEMAKSSYKRKKRQFEVAKQWRSVNVVEFASEGENPLTVLLAGVDEDNLRELRHNFSALWKVLTWNALLSSSILEDVKEKSQLKSQLFRGLEGYTALHHIEEMCADHLLLAKMEQDLQEVNEFLRNRGISLLLLYDRLDTIVPPRFWSKVVSPLFNWWSESNRRYRNILPKIFARTDLFARITGTNKVRLESQLISIDWTIEEVFGYMVKMLLSSALSRRALCSLAEVRMAAGLPAFETEVVDESESRSWQLENCGRKLLEPFVEMLFGKEIKSDKMFAPLDPWEYFSRDLSNADGTISLRLFVSIFQRNAATNVDALEKAKSLLNDNSSCVFASNAFASREMRVSATNQYFEDLAGGDDFNSDLLLVKELLTTNASGVDFKWQTLSQAQFEEFARLLLMQYQNKLTTVRNPNDLRDLLMAAGVLAEQHDTRTTQYSFASMYHYAWGLRRRVEPVDLSEIDNAGRPGSFSNLPLGILLKGEYRELDKGNFVAYKGKYIKVDHNYRPPYGTYYFDGDSVSFKIKQIDVQGTPFYVADKLEPVEEV